jgi:pyruvate-formate lyase-activating enzyme
MEGNFLRFHPQNRMKSAPPVASGDLKKRCAIGKADGINAKDKAPKK